jgi:micrococcal nuclease
LLTKKTIPLPALEASKGIVYLTIQKMKKLALLFFFLVLGVSAFSAEIRGKVVGVIDGDTITVLDSAKQNYRIRLDKIDAPEQGQAFGARAKQFLSALIFGKQVVVQYEKRDQYDRILGVIYLGKYDVNLYMVKSGMAWHYKYYDKTTEYAEAEEFAREQKKGLWFDSHPINPYEFRKQQRYK